MTRRFDILRGAASAGDGPASGRSFDKPVFEETTKATGELSNVAAAVLAPGSMAAEEFRLLRAKVKAIGAERSFRCVGIVSATGGEGKSTISLGLAQAMAQEPNKRILLVEADLRKSVIEGYLGLPRTAGLAEWLQGSERTVHVRRVVPQGFDLLSAGHATGEHPELLGSSRMTELLEAARHHFDFVVVDCPPLVPVADSVVLQDLLDGFLFVVRARHSPRETLLKALSHLKPDRVQGLVFNDHREIIPGYYSYGYRQYGQYR